jgi:RNA-dependent RNA polymerase
LKKLSRQGQCFSGTKFIATLLESEIKIIDDIIRGEGDREFCFTDGIGNISTEIAGLIDEKYDLNKCSAYQVRMGGVKGVLMHDPNLKDRLVEIRPSQTKVNSKDTDLEIVRCATYSQGYLNRQIIMLMSCQGVEDDVFMEKLG